MSGSFREHNLQAEVCKMSDKLISVFSRIVFIVAIVILAVAILDWILRLFGYTLSFLPYQPGRLMEFSTILIVLVIALLLRQIRDSVKKP